MDTVFAIERWPDTCSCGIKYIDHEFDREDTEDKKQYRKHLNEYHLVP